MNRHVFIRPGDVLDVEVEGLGILYSIITDAPDKYGEMGIEVIDRANETSIDENTHVIEEAPMDHYAIQSIDDPNDWWSNEDGWVDKPSRTIFTREERDSLNLPMEGQWVHADPNEEVTPCDDEFPDAHSHEPQEIDDGLYGVHALDSEGRHYYLEAHVTDEGLVVSVYDRYGEREFATLSLSFDELVDHVFTHGHGPGDDIA